MNHEPYLTMLRTIKSIAFATVDSLGNPQVRIIDVMLIENGNIYFLTARGKSFYHELISQKKVAVVGLSKDYQAIRISGQVKHVERFWLDKMFDENPSMNEVYPNQTRNVLEAFCIDSGSGECFDLSEHPIKRTSFSFGGVAVQEHGYEILSKCITCGRCTQVCPQQCIKEGKPYQIIQENCLHCGACFEACPVEAIQARDD